MGKSSLERQQVARFQEAARALGCDEDEAAFDEKLRGIAGKKPKVDPTPTTMKKSPSEH